MKNLLRKIPILGPIGYKLASAIRNTGRVLRGKNKARRYSFRRAELDNGEDDTFDRSIKQAVNLLNYTKTSGATYNGVDFPAGYHTLQINGVELPGQREPAERLELLPFDFTNKTVLDIGCNQGGMLFAVGDRISQGIGIDYDSRLINTANKIRSLKRAANLDFYVFNLEDENLSVIKDFLPDKKVDVVFLLSVCMWIKNWKEVINLATEVSDCLLFESNGRTEQQEEQIAYLRDRYKSVQQLSEKSEDDKSQKNRKLFYCS